MYVRPPSFHMMRMLRELDEAGGMMIVKPNRCCTMIALEKRDMVIGKPFPETGQPEYVVKLLKKGRKELKKCSR